MLLDLKMNLLVTILASDGREFLSAHGARDSIIALVSLQVPGQVSFTELLVADGAFGVLKRKQLNRFRF